MEPDLEISLAVAKIGKYATSESGDTLEVVERPHGGISVVLADGQRSGKGAKQISNIAVRKTIALLADGVRDGAAARAAHDYLRTHRRGQVSATLNIISVDLDSRTLVVSRNSHCPAFLHNPEWTDNGGWRVLDESSEPIGIRSRTKPSIAELSLEIGTTVLVFTDGIWSAGERYGERIDLRHLVDRILVKGHDNPQQLADCVLSEAISLDKGRPMDDMSLVVLGIRASEHPDKVRRMQVSFPI